MSSNLASVKVVVEDDDAKVANISKDVASVASQTVLGLRPDHSKCRD